MWSRLSSKKSSLAVATLLLLVVSSAVPAQAVEPSTIQNQVIQAAAQRQQQLEATQDNQLIEGPIEISTTTHPAQSFVPRVKLWWHWGPFWIWQLDHQWVLTIAVLKV